MAYCCAVVPAAKSFIISQLKEIILVLISAAVFKLTAVHPRPNALIACAAAQFAQTLAQRAVLLPPGNDRHTGNIAHRSHCRTFLRLLDCCIVYRHRGTATVGSFLHFRTDSAFQQSFSNIGSSFQPFIAANTDMPRQGIQRINLTFQVIGCNARKINR